MTVIILSLVIVVLSITLVVREYANAKRRRALMLHMLTKLEQHQLSQSNK